MADPPRVQLELPARKSLAILAVLVVFIVLFSYLFTLALAAACAILPYLMLGSLHAENMQLIILFPFGLIMAGTLVWSIVPRRDAFVAPWPSMTQSAQPRLFAEIEKIAKALDESLPDAVYLVPEVNAWVAKRGGILGLGGKRVLGVGLPLLSTLSLSQFRAILAHEFGHYYSGDTKLGPLMYGARSIMVRTFSKIGGSGLLGALDRVAVANLAHRLVIAVLQAYWQLFLRAAQWISRRQEYRADELACAVAGSEALMGGLRRIAATSTAEQLFWQSQIFPALQSGFRLPIGEGFARFVAMPNIASAALLHVEREIAGGKTRAYDSHPPLRDRLEAAAAFPSHPAPEANEPALALLDDVDELEAKLIGAIVPQVKVSNLKVAGWDELGAAVYVPSWRAIVGQNASALVGVKVRDLPALATNPKEIARLMRDPPGSLLTHDQRNERARVLLSTALVLVMVDHGWDLHASPSEISLTRAGETVKPDELSNLIRSGKMSQQEWDERIRAWQMEDAELSPALRQSAP